MVARRTGRLRWNLSSPGLEPREVSALMRRGIRDQNDIEAAAALRLEFHTQPYEEAHDVPIEERLPTVLYLLGLTTLEITYKSLKDDPLTRMPAKRVKDPKGVYGVWKLFEHQMRCAGMYCSERRMAQEFYKAGVPAYFAEETFDVDPADIGVRVKWPKAATFLGRFEQATIVDLWDQKRIIKVPGADLWSFPNRKTIFALQREVPILGAAPRANPSPQRVLLWHGCDLDVTPMGIHGG